MYRRYLTKISDQVIALLSREHATAIVWGDQDSDVNLLTWKPAILTDCSRLKLPRRMSKRKRQLHDRPFRAHGF
jgi:hypothetical protein